MTLLIVGLFVLLIGTILTAADVSACEYERRSTGPALAAFGAVITLAASLDALF